MYLYLSEHLIYDFWSCQWIKTGALDDVTDDMSDNITDNPEPNSL